MSERDGKQKPFTVSVDFEGKPDKPIDVAAYLFDGSGQLLASAPIRNGKATLAPAQVGRSARLLIGPALGDEQRDTPPTLATIEALDPHRPA